MGDGRPRDAYHIRALFPTHRRASLATGIPGWHMAVAVALLPVWAVGAAVRWAVEW